MLFAGCILYHIWTISAGYHVRNAHLYDQWHRDLPAPRFQLPDRRLHLLNLEIELQARQMYHLAPPLITFNPPQLQTRPMYSLLLFSPNISSNNSCPSPSSSLPCAAEYVPRGLCVPQV